MDAEFSRAALPAVGPPRPVVSQKELTSLTLTYKLWLQTWLDGEQRSENVRERNREPLDNEAARSLLSALRWIKAALAQNELERNVPVSRKRYWIKIERAIRGSRVRESDGGMAPGEGQGF